PLDGPRPVQDAVRREKPRRLRVVRHDSRQIALPEASKVVSQYFLSGGGHVLALHCSELQNSANPNSSQPVRASVPYAGYCTPLTPPAYIGSPLAGTRSLRLRRIPPPTRPGKFSAGQWLVVEEDVNVRRPI